MQSMNQFLDFAGALIRRYQNFGPVFDAAPMVYLEGQPEEETQGIQTQQNFVTNLYHIQNVKEENYLYMQNLNFLTQILEKRMYQQLYPDVREQIVRTVKEELPKADERILHSFSEQLLKQVEKEGTETIISTCERLLSEYHETETKTLSGQTVLSRKLENIINNSIYVQAPIQVEQVENAFVVRKATPGKAFKRKGEILTGKTSRRETQTERTSIGNLGQIFHTELQFLSGQDGKTTIQVSKVSPVTLDYLEEKEEHAQTKPESLQRIELERQRQMELESLRRVELKQQRQMEQISQQQIRESLETTEQILQKIRTEAVETIRTESHPEETQGRKPGSKVLEPQIPGRDTMHLVYAEESPEEQSEEPRVSSSTTQPQASTQPVSTVQPQATTQPVSTVQPQATTQPVSTVQPQPTISPEQPHSPTAQSAPLIQPVSLEYLTQESDESHATGEPAQTTTEAQRSSQSVQVTAEQQLSTHPAQVTVEQQLSQSVGRGQYTPSLETAEQTARRLAESMQQTAFPSLESTRQSREIKEHIIQNRDVLDLVYAEEGQTQTSKEESQSPVEIFLPHLSVPQPTQMTAESLPKRQPEQTVPVPTLPTTSDTVSSKEQTVGRGQYTPSSEQTASLSAELAKQAAEMQKQIQNRGVMDLVYAEEDKTQPQETGSLVEAAPSVPNPSEPLSGKQSAEKATAGRPAEEAAAGQRPEAVGRFPEAAQSLLDGTTLETILKRGQYIPKGEAHHPIQEAMHLVYSEAHPDAAFEQGAMVTGQTPAFEQAATVTGQTPAFEQATATTGQTTVPNLQHLSSDIRVLRPLLIAGQRQSHLQKNVGKPRTANNNKNNKHIQLMHEAAQMVFNEEEHSGEKSLQETVKLKKQVEEVVQNLKTVEEKTVVQSRTIIEQQKQVVKEVLKESPAIWQEEKGAAFIRQEVQKSIEDQIDESVSQIAGRVYRNLEQRLKIERGRRGLG